MFYILLTPTRTAQTLGLVNKYVFIFNEFAAELASITYSYSHYSSSAANFFSEMKNKNQSKTKL